MKKAALFPAQGLGDALLMLIAAHSLHLAGWEVTLYHNTAIDMQSWFPHVQFKKVPCLEKNLLEEPLIIAQNDNSSLIQHLLQLYRSHLSLFYPTYLPQKHAPLSKQDFVFSSLLSMAQNIANAASVLSGHFTRVNGIVIPSHLYYRLFSQRISIHPTSREEKKNWKASRFIQLAKKLQYLGFHPLFVASPSERKQWSFVENLGFTLKTPLELSDLMALIYESGYCIGNDSFSGHLASCLNIPSVTLASCPKHMQLWQPGWNPSKIVYPPFYLPSKFKARFWKHLISSRRVLKALLYQTLNEQTPLTNPLL